LLNIDPEAGAGKIAELRRRARAVPRERRKR